MGNIQKGLVGHWTMNSEDASGGTLYDRSAYDNHGTINGATPGSNAMKFEASNNDYINTQSTGDLNFNSTKKYTISVWVKASDNGDAMVVRHLGTHRARFVLNNGPDMVYNDDTGTWQGISTGGNAQDNNWHHVVWVIDSGKLIGYVDGQQVGTDTFPESNTDCKGDIQIGRGSGSSEYLDGFLSDLRIYPDRSVTKEEVRKLYNQNKRISISVKGVATSSSNPFSSLSQLDTSNYSNGFSTLYTDFGEDGISVPVDVLFGETGGPYVAMSFNFTGNGGVNKINDTAVAAGYSSSNGIYKVSKNFDFGLGRGTIDGRDFWHPSKSLYENDNGVITNNTGWYSSDPSYYNHGSGSNLSKTEEVAFRTWAKRLHPDTPHVAYEVDDENKRNTTYYYDSPYEENIGGGFAIWVEANGKAAFPITNTPAPSNDSSYHFWDQESYEFFTSDTSTSYDSYQAPSSAGLSDIHSGLLVPEEITLGVQTGGGCIFGTPYTTNVDSGNFRNSRTYFLISDTV